MLTAARVSRNLGSSSYLSEAAIFDGIGILCLGLVYMVLSCNCGDFLGALKKTIIVAECL